MIPKIILNIYDKNSPLAMVIDLPPTVDFRQIFVPQKHPQYKT
jgi:hypothetical protein